MKVRIKPVEKKEESNDEEGRIISSSIEEGYFSNEVTDEKEEVSLDNEETEIDLVMATSDGGYSDFGDLAFF